MTKIIVGENLILVAVKEVKQGSIITAGGLLVPTQMNTPKGNVGAGDTVKTEWGIYLEIVDCGSKVDKEVYKPGRRVKLLTGYLDGITSFDIENYTNNKERGTYIFIEPRIIACMFEYENDGAKPEVTWKGDNVHWTQELKEADPELKEKMERIEARNVNVTHSCT